MIYGEPETSRFLAAVQRLKREGSGDGNAAQHDLPAEHGGLTTPSHQRGIGK